MRIIAVVLALVATQASAELSFKGDGIEMRLLDRACTHPKILALLKDEWKPRFQQGQLVYHGRPLQMCWAEIRPGQVVIVDEDGDGAEVPKSAFKKVNAL